MNRTARKLLIPGVGIVLATSGFAFMASNSVASSNAGVGQAAVSGYNVHDVHYAIVTNPNTPGGTYIQQINFTLNPHNATNVLAWFEDSSGNFVSGYYSCTSTDGGTSWNCQNPDVINGHQWAATGDAEQLHVSAAQ